jgi:hypothetical protein
MAISHCKAAPLAYASISKISKRYCWIGFLQCATCFCAEKTPVSEMPDDRVNYPSNFQVEGGCNLFLFGDYLYWIAQEDSLYYAQAGVGSGSSEFDGHLKKVEPQWDSGLRIGAGVNFPKEGYDLLFTWTWFSTDASSKKEGSLLSLWAHPDAPSTTTSHFAKGKWDLDIQLFDLEWGRSSWFGGNFSLRPFFGVRALFLQQNLKNFYAYDTIPTVIGKMHSASDFQGGGMRAGADVRFAFTHGFSLYGLASGSLLYGRFDADFRLTEAQLAIGSGKDHFNKGISSLQLALGLAWDTHFASDRLHIEFHVGWEQNGWFSINQMNHFMQQMGSGVYFQENSNLSLQGLVVGGRFDF